MRLLLLHGSAILSSRQKLAELRHEFEINNIVVFEKGSNPSVSDLTTPNLLGEDQLIILENPPEDFAVDSSFAADNLLLILWFDHEVSEKKVVLEWVKNTKGEVIFFPDAKEISIFPLLDLLGNRKKEAFLEVNKFKDFDTQYFITMIFYLLRNLVATPKGAKDFVRNKNAKMRINFSGGELKEIYKFILETDFKIKSGLLESSQAEFVLINKFTS